MNPSHTSSPIDACREDQNRQLARPHPRKHRLLFLLAALFSLGIARTWATPLIFNATETANPGEIVYLQGDNFTTTAQVWFHRVLTTDTTLTPDTQLNIVTQSNQAITVELPTNMPLGLYAIWVKDSSGTLSAPNFINKARAMNFEFPEVSPGYTFRIFGRNLLMSGATPSATFVSGTSTYPATVLTGTATNNYVLQVIAPTGILSGTTYTVNVSNGYGHNATANFDVNASETTIAGRAGGTDSFNLGVPWGADFSSIAANVVNVVTGTNPHTGLPYGADSTGGTNCLSILQQALTDAGNATLYPNGATVYIPSGTFLINRAVEGSSLNLTANVVLQGAGITQTTINDTTPAFAAQNWFLTFGYDAPYNSTLSGATGFTYNQTAPGISGTLAPPGVRNYSSSSSKLFLDHIAVNGAYFVSGTTQLMCPQFIPQGTNTNRLLMQYCALEHCRFGTANVPGGGTYGSNYIFRNNSNTSYFARMEFAYIENLLIEDNHFTRDGNFPPADYNGSITDGCIDPTQTNVKVLNNTLDAINLPLPYRNDGETIMNQNGANYDFGTPTAITGTSITDTTKAWTTNLYAGGILAIVNGPGMGQRASIVGNTSNTVTIAQAWTENPTTASTYSLTHPGADRWLVQGNQLSDVPRGIVFYTGGYDSAIVNNTMNDVGETIFLNGGQRTLSGTSWYGRLDLNWKDVIADNISLVSTGTFADTTTSNYNGNAVGGNTLVGTTIFGTEFRRNILEAHIPNLKDTAIDETEGYNNWGAIISGSHFVETNIPAILGTIYDDNIAINTTNALFINTESYQTTIWNQLNLNVTNPISDTMLLSATHASVDTVSTTVPNFLEVNFNSTGTSTGGAGDIIDSGGEGLLYAGSGSSHATITGTSPFTITSGSYLECTIGPGTGSSGHITITPTTARTSWGRIFDFRIGQWLVNGGFDFFWRPLQAPAAADAMRPIDITNGANGIRLVFSNISGTSVQMQVITSTGGGGLTLYGTYAPGFAANQIYHIGVTYATVPTTGVTTEKVFIASGTGAINTGTSTNLITSGTFMLIPSIDYNASGYLSSGTWNFGDAYGSGALNVNDYDALMLYYEDPGTFPGL